MATAPHAPQIGLDESGQLPLPWLAPALHSALALQKAHALLLFGPPGAGHLELALLLAQAQLCEQPQAQGQACGRCASCHLMRQRAHTDVLLVLPDALRVQYGWVGEDEGKLSKADAKPSRSIRVEQVRDAIAWGQQTSGRGRGKVLVVHPADALNATSANALLKTLEEPPGTLRILLTSADPERLLPTVRSRCQRVRLQLPMATEASRWLRAQGLAEPEPLLALAGGSPLEALALAAEGITGEALASWPQRVAAGDASVLAGRSVPRAIELMLKLAHDAQVQAAGGAPRFFEAASLPAAAHLPGLVSWQRALLRAARHEDHPWNAGLLVESLVSQALAAWPVAPKAAAARPAGRA